MMSACSRSSSSAPARGRRMQLADLGAEVIKIEDPASGGDVGRYVPPYRDGEDSLYFETFNRGKRSVSLDLRSAAGRAVFEDLVRPADAVYSNLRGDQPAKLRITYDDLRELNPRIVCCSLSGFGTTGPRRAEPAYDYVLQALTGWMSLTGEPDGPPVKSGLSLVDFSGGYVSALALLAGVWRARRDGVGCDCDTSLFETALSLLTYVGTWAASREHVTERRAESAHPSIVPFQAFQTADGWITVAAAKQKFWLGLCAALAPELAEDPRFAGFEERSEHRDALLAILRPRFARGRDGRARRAPVRGRRPVRRGQRRARRARRSAGRKRATRSCSYEHPRLGTVRQPASPFRLGTEYRRGARRAARTRRRSCASSAATTTRRSRARAKEERSDDGQARLEGPVLRGLRGRRRLRAPARAHGPARGQLVVHAAHAEHRGPALRRPLRGPDGVGTAAGGLDVHARAGHRAERHRRLPERDGQPRLGRGPAAGARLRGRHDLLRVRGARRCATRRRGPTSASSPWPPRATTRTASWSSPSSARCSSTAAITPRPARARGRCRPADGDLGRRRRDRARGSPASSRGPRTARRR